MFADIQSMSEGGLRGMQRAIHDRLIEEDSQPPGQPRTYGLRDYPDWKRQSDEIEAELDRRGLVYKKVPW